MKACVHPDKRAPIFRECVRPATIGRTIWDRVEDRSRRPTCRPWCHTSEPRPQLRRGRLSLPNDGSGFGPVFEARLRPNAAFQRIYGY